MYRAFADAKLPGGEVVYLTLDIHPQTLPKVTSPLGSPAFSVWVRVPSGAPSPEQAIDRLLRFFYRQNVEFCNTRGIKII